MPRIGPAILNTVEYWDGIYSRHEYPTLDSNNMQRYESAASMQLGMSALDIGCGQMGLGYVLLKQQPEQFFYLGCDFSEAGLRSHILPRGRGGRWDFVLCDWRKVGALGLFDTVYLCDILEHAEEPAQLLALAVGAARLRVVISVPRYEAIPFPLHRGEHAWDFTLEELAELAKPYGELSQPIAAGVHCYAMNITLGAQ